MAVDPLVIAPTITNVGLAACLRAEGDGIEARLSHMSVGRGLPDGAGWKGYVPSRTQVALYGEQVKVPLVSGTKIPDYGFRVLARIPRTTDGSEAQVREVGWWLESGELLCVWSEVAPAPLAYRTPRAEVDLAHDLHLTQVPLGSLNITVQQPDVPEMAGVLAEVVALGARQIIASLNVEQRLSAGKL